jgi:hypothetical protein
VKSVGRVTPLLCGCDILCTVESRLQWLVATGARFRDPGCCFYGGSDSVWRR